MKQRNARLIILFFILIGMPFDHFGQKKMLVEKVGSNQKFYFAKGDRLKIRLTSPDTVLVGKIIQVNDSDLVLSGLRDQIIPLRTIKSVYKEYRFLKKFSRASLVFGGVIFGVIVTNHLLNNEQVFTQDLFIISGAFLGASIITAILAEKQCKIGTKWKIKILDYTSFK